jgi:hypothetical protein
MSPESVLSESPPDMSLERFLPLCFQILEYIFPFPDAPSSHALFCIHLHIVLPESGTNMSGPISEALAHMHCSAFLCIWYLWNLE